MNRLRNGEELETTNIDIFGNFLQKGTKTSDSCRWEKWT